MRRPLPHRSTCSYCGVGCGLRVGVDGRRRLRVEGDPDHPANRGALCSKGLTLAYAMEDQGDRLHHPEIRRSRGEPLQRVGWDEAIGHVANEFRRIIAGHGPDAVALYVSGQCLTEEYYLANKLVKGFLGTNNIDTNSRLCMSSAAAAYTQTLGEDCVPTCYDDIDLADCIFIAGANPAWCHPILFRRIEARRATDPSLKVIVADPRRTESCSIADLHLPVAPGTDIVLFQAIARVLIESGWIDRDFLAGHVDGYDAYRAAVFELSVAEAAARCRVPADDIERAAAWIGGSKGFLTMWAMGLNQSAVGVEKNVSLIALNLITGKIGRPGSGPFSLTGQPNAMGGREVGGMATLLAAHRDLANAAHREEVAAFWGVERVRPEPGLTATEMFDALADRTLRAIWIVATNPMVSLPDVNRAEAALESAELVVVQDISRLSDTVRFADVVLPAAGHFEKSGTMTNSERRVSYLEQVVEPPGEARPDSEIFLRFARAMGFHGFDFAHPHEVFDEYARLTAGTHIDISGLSHGLLRERGPVQWPFPADAAARDGHGTARLFADGRFHTTSGRARLVPVPGGLARSEPVTDDRPLVLTTGRIRDQWHTMTKTGKVRRLTRHIERPTVAMHPEDARARGIGNGDPVSVWNARGEARLPAEITEDVSPGVVFVPMHWGRVGDHTGARANNLTSAVVDPVSKEPDFKYSAVQVTRGTKPRERVLVVGAGAAAYRFVTEYRRLAPADEIHVFSREPWAFYDRVRLPEYVAERLSWEDLLKFRDGELEDIDLVLHASTAVSSIDPARRVIVDEHGREHRYDRLVVATGSRAFVPPDLPAGLTGVLTMRTRADAERLRARVHEGSRVLVVGGGLLGLELAAALIDMNAHVTVVELGERLMERQLDATASDLLRRHMEALGAAVRVKNSVCALQRAADTDGLRVTLQSGSAGVFDAVVVAVGTRPNVELLAACGVECARGVRVNDHLQTSDPHIYALGEIAEHRRTLHGVTAAAEEQAEVAARHIAGDPLARYDGSLRMNVLKVSDLHVSSVGIAEAPAGEEGYDEVVVLDRAEGYYKKCIVKDDRLVGAILVGDGAELGEFKDLVKSGWELADRRAGLLRAGTRAEPVLGRLVCACGNVGDGNIRRAVDAGRAGLAEVCTATGAGIGCGSCKPEIRRLLDGLQAAAAAI